MSDDEPTVSKGIPSICLVRVKDPKNLVKDNTYLVGEVENNSLVWCVAVWDMGVFMITASGETMSQSIYPTAMEGDPLEAVTKGYVFELPASPNDTEESLIRMRNMYD